LRGQQTIQIAQAKPKKLKVKKAEKVEKVKELAFLAKSLSDKGLQPQVIQVVSEKLHGFKLK
jgi:competence protein ComGF